MLIINNSGTNYREFIRRLVNKYMYYLGDKFRGNCCDMRIMAVSCSIPSIYKHLNSLTTPFCPRKCKK